MQSLTREERVALAAYFHRTVERGLGQVGADQTGLALAPDLDRIEALSPDRATL